MRGLSAVVSSGGCPSLQHRGSPCRGSSCLGARAPGHAGSAVVAHRLSCSMARGILVPGPGMEPVSPELAGRFLTLGPPEKSLSWTFDAQFGGEIEVQREEVIFLSGMGQMADLSSTSYNRISHPHLFQGALQAAFTVDHRATGSGMHLCGLISLGHLYSCHYFKRNRPRELLAQGERGDTWN